jgi:hypothetical protein
MAKRMIGMAFVALLGVAGVACDGGTDEGTGTGGVGTDVDDGLGDTGPTDDEVGGGTGYGGGDG